MGRMRAVENRLHVGGDSTQGTSIKDGRTANREVEQERGEKSLGGASQAGPVSRTELDDILLSVHRTIYLHDILFYYMFYL
jgi:hypothetical protein